MQCFGFTVHLNRCKRSACRWGLGLFCRRHTVQGIVGIVTVAAGVVSFMANIHTLFPPSTDYLGESQNTAQIQITGDVSTQPTKQIPMLKLMRKDLKVIAEWSGVPCSDKYHFYLLQKNKYGRLYAPIMIHENNGNHKVIVSNDDITQIVIANFLTGLTLKNFPTTGEIEDSMRLSIVAWGDIPPREKDR